MSMPVRWERRFERQGRTYVVVAELPFSEDPNYLEISVHQSTPHPAAPPQTEALSLAPVVYAGGLEGYPVTGVNFRAPVGEGHRAVADDLMAQVETDFCRRLDATAAPQAPLRAGDDKRTLGAGPRAS